MKRIYSIVVALLLISGPSLNAQSEAGAIFLLISPGARAGGMGEAQVAVANDAFASYWNPAGLAFQEGSEIAFMHVNWLPNLADDLYYEFLGFRRHFPNLGTLGGHLIYLNLGEQVRMDEYAQYQGKFTSYMMATAFSYSTKLSSTSSFGMNAKISYQHLVEIGTGSEKGKGTSTDFGFDLGYMKKGFEDTPPLCVFIARSKFIALSSLHSLSMSVEDGSLGRSKRRSICGFCSNTGLEYDHVRTEIEAFGRACFKL